MSGLVILLGTCSVDRRKRMAGLFPLCRHCRQTHPHCEDTYTFSHDGNALSIQLETGSHFEAERGHLRRKESLLYYST